MTTLMRRWLKRLIPTFRPEPYWPVSLNPQVLFYRDLLENQNFIDLRALPGLWNEFSKLCAFDFRHWLGFSERRVGPDGVPAMVHSILYVPECKVYIVYYFDDNVYAVQPPELDDGTQWELVEQIAEAAWLQHYSALTVEPQSSDIVH